MAEQFSASMAKRLREMKARFNAGKEEAKKNSAGGTTLLPGQRYLTRLGKTKLVETDDGPAMVFEFTAIEGDQTGEKGVIFHSMATDEKVVYLLRDLRKLGFEIDEIDPEKDLPEICDSLNKDAPIVKVRVVEKGQYLNVWIQKVIDVGGGESLGEVPAGDVPTMPAPAKPAPAAPKALAKPAGTAAAASKPAGGRLPPPEAAQPQEAAAQAEEPEPADAEAVEEVAEELAVGMRVSYNAKGVPRTGVVTKLPDAATAHIRDDEKQTVVSANIEKNRVSALIETAAE